MICVVWTKNIEHLGVDKMKTIPVDVKKLNVADIGVVKKDKTQQTKLKNNWIWS